MDVPTLLTSPLVEDEVDMCEHLMGLLRTELATLEARFLSSLKQWHQSRKNGDWSLRQTAAPTLLTSQGSRKYKSSGRGLQVVGHKDLATSTPRHGQSQVDHIAEIKLSGDVVLENSCSILLDSQLPATLTSKDQRVQFVDPCPSPCSREAWGGQRKDSSPEVVQSISQPHHGQRKDSSPEVVQRISRPPNDRSSDKAVKVLAKRITAWNLQEGCARGNVEAKRKQLVFKHGGTKVALDPRASRFSGSVVLSSTCTAAELLPEVSDNQVLLLKIDEADFWTSCRLVAEVVVCSMAFDYFMSVLIFTHGLCIGLQTDYMSRKLVEEAPLEAVLEAVFGTVFTLECGLRLFVFRARFFSMPSWQWNLLEFALVALQLGEAVAAAVGVMAAGGVEAGGDLAAVQLLRLVRIMRIVRMLRMLRFITELRMIVSAVLNCFRPFLWTMLLLLLFIYVFGVFLTQIVLNYRLVHSSSPNLERYYGNLVLSLLSLFEAVSGGVDWENMVNPLIEIHWSGGVFFVAFISFSLFALLNVVTGTFVESSLAKTKEDKESFLNEQLSNLFHRLDIDLSGVLQWCEFEKHLDDSELCEYFQALNLSTAEARSLFALLDTDCSGGVDALEFVMGCLQLPKPAKSSDVMLLTQEMRTELQDQKMQIQSIHTLCRNLLQSQKEVSSKEMPQGCMDVLAQEQYWSSPPG